MDARPIEVGFRRRRADSDMDAGDLEGGEELRQSMFEGCRHAICIGVEEQAREFAKYYRGHGTLFGEDDGIAVAPECDRRGRGPALGVFEDEDADGLGSLKVLFAY